MDKFPVYPGAIPLDTDDLKPQRAVEIALGFMMQAAFGTNTVIDGLAVSQQTSPNMTVKVGPGCIIFATTVDTLTSGFGSLPVDNANPLVKIGQNLTATTMAALTAPAIAGQSQNWLVEAQFLEADGSPVVLPFYNAANPTVPFTGPTNSGATSNTARTSRVQLQWKGGTAAATGTQNTPSPDAGWVGVAVVTVANGATSITNSNIAPYSLAPYVPTKLSAQRTKLTSNLNLYVSATGSDTAGSGLAASSPFATLQHAWDYLFTNIDLSGFGVGINIANGSYTSGVVATGMPPGFGTNSFINFLGNTGAPSNVVITTSNAHCFNASIDCHFNVAGVTMAASGTAGGNAACCLVASLSSTITLTGACIFGIATGYHIWANNSGQVNASGIGYTVTGGAVAHYAGTIASFINMSSIAVTLSGTPAFSKAFAYCALSAYIQAFTWTFSGSATGVRYEVDSNGLVNTAAGGASYFPGGSAGTTSTQGQYF